MKSLMTAAATATMLISVPALAGGHERGDRHAAIFSDSNSHYLDYQTDLSEAKRELQNDLRSADSDSDRIEAYAEYEREVADAEGDFRKEMAERGVLFRRGTVTVE
ncbi:hypothetical protein NYR55_07485 [Sphingomonas sp. BGYR3]|uniref:hypothetical protein n=1 Tax=Sphingomonas sp. BGYR3 TaxID=2975483 RepID=UPI0021A693F6|nr:hypothetical protein [Sphingomonas sp. BGYR3]MDG5488455.1 hypothetical protein [Sphingomonas sp. BGYR3]